MLVVVATCIIIQYMYKYMYLRSMCLCYREKQRLEAELVQSKIALEKAKHLIDEGTCC